MKKMKLLSVVAAVVAAASQSASALTFVDAGTVAPTGSYISNPQGSPTTGANNTFFNSNNTGGVGQSFTATTNATIYTVTVKGAAYRTAVGTGTFSAADFTLQFGSISDLNVSATYTQTAKETVNVPAGTINLSPLNYNHYFTFTLATPVTVVAGQTYAFDINTVTAANSTDYVTFNANTNSTYAGGAALALNSTTSPSSVNSVSGSDLIFFLGTTAPVPEPSQWALVPVLGTIAFLAFRRFRNQSVA